MTILHNFDMSDAIRLELYNYDTVKSLLNEHDETSVHHAYLVEELLDCKNNILAAGFHLLEWN